MMFDFSEEKKTSRIKSRVSPLKGRHNQSHQLQHEKEFTPWSEDDHIILTKHFLKKPPQHRIKIAPLGKQAKSISPRSLNRNKIKIFNGSKINNESENEVTFKPSLVSMQLDQQIINLSPKSKYLRKDCLRQTTKEPSRIRLTKRFSEEKGQNQDIYNRTIEMFSTGLTDKISRELVSDTLIIYQAMPKRNPRFSLKNKLMRSMDSKQGYFPSLSTPRENQDPEKVQLKGGQGLKIKIRDLRKEQRSTHLMMMGNRH